MKAGFVHELFSQAAEQFCDQTAIEDGIRTITYQELANRANNLANFFLDNGISRGSRIVILADDRIATIASIIGILQASCVFVPLDPKMPLRRQREIVNKVAPSWILSEVHFASLLDLLVADLAIRPEVIYFDSNRSEDSSEFHQYDTFSNYLNISSPPRHSEPDDMCYIYFTSGSTGKPKGIAGRLKAIDHFIKWEIKTFQIQQGYRVSQLTTPTFDAFLRDIFVPLCAGGTVCIPNEPDTLLDSSKLIQFLHQRSIQLVHCVPSVLRTILQGDLTPDHFPEMRFILLAGEALQPVEIRRWIHIFQERVQLVNLYGPSETTMVKFFYHVQPTDGNRASIPIGKPIEGARGIVVDDQGHICAPGKIGEIYIRTPYRSLGYYNEPDLTREVFIQNPFSNNLADIVYKTGDLGRLLSNGMLEFLGRKDQQVKIRGVRVELGEIERQLREHELVEDAVVIDLLDPSGNKYICAYLVSSQEIQSNELREFLAAHLSPTSIPSLFISVAALPRTITGKVDRQALPPPDRASLVLSGSFIAPRTPLEKQLSALWAEMLKLDHIGIHDNFFELGGHSLLAVQVINKLQKTYSVNISLVSFFRAATLADLARTIEQAPSNIAEDQKTYQTSLQPSLSSPQSASSSLVAIQPYGSKLPFFCIHAASGDVLSYYHLAYHLQVDRPFYGLQARGLDEGQEPFTRIEDMAKHYIELLSALQSSGPYLLGGWSMGATVALEMAQRLQSQGHHITLLVSFDGRAPRFGDDLLADDTPLDDASLTAAFARDYGVPVPVDNFLQLQQEEQLHILLQQAKKVYLLPSNAQISHMRRLLHVYTTHIRATRSYKAHAIYPGHLALFRASESMTKNLDEPTKGWKRIVTQDIQLHDVPGNHYTMFRPPNVEVLAAKLRTTLLACP